MGGRRVFAAGVLTVLLAGYCPVHPCLAAVTTPAANQEFETGTASIDFQWDPIDLASAYKLKLLLNGSVFGSIVRTPDTGLSLARAYGPGYYSALVCGVTPAGTTAWSEPVTFIVKRAMTPCDDRVFTRPPAAFKWTRSPAATRYLVKLARLDQATGKYKVKQTVWVPKPVSGTPCWRPAAGSIPLGRYKWSVTDYTGEKPGYTSASYFSVEIVAPAGMVPIPAGRFSMGDGYSEGYVDERPVHTVFVSEFYMDECEVTAALWTQVRAWGKANGYRFSNAGAGKASTHPVHSINWFDAVKWCNARSQMEGRPPVYFKDAALTQVYKSGELTPYVKWTAPGYRLPTEAEWERAARGGADGHRFPWSDSEVIQHARANYYSWAGSYPYDASPTHGFHPSWAGGEAPYTSPVGSFAANGFGLYDMAGNISEMCWDRYSSTYYTTSPSSNPRGPASGSYRVRRGGDCGFFSLADLCRVVSRTTMAPDQADILFGFRTALTSGQ